MRCFSDNETEIVTNAALRAFVEKANRCAALVMRRPIEEVIPFWAPPDFVAILADDAAREGFLDRWEEVVAHLAMQSDFIRREDWMIQVEANFDKTKGIVTRIYALGRSEFDDV